MEPQLPTVDICSSIYPVLTPITLSNSPHNLMRASWDQLPNKLPAPKSLISWSAFEETQINATSFGIILIHSNPCLITC